MWLFSWLGRIWRHPSRREVEQPSFYYPTNAELAEIAQDLMPRLTDGRPVFQTPSDSFDVEWHHDGNVTAIYWTTGESDALR